MSEQAEVADAHKTDRQYMQQEAAQKLMHTESHAPLFVLAPRITPAERDLMIFERQQAVTGNSHAMCIAAQIVDHMLGSSEGTFGVHHPILLVNRSQ